MKNVMNIEAGPGEGQYDNAQIGEGTLVEPNVRVGFRYHPDCGPARIGSNGILRAGTIIYGDVAAGDYFQTGHYTVIRARTEFGHYCSVSNHSTLEGLTRLGDGTRIMSHVYIPTRTCIGSHVFIGPGVTFLNDKYPYRSRAAWTITGAVIEDDVVIGGGAIIFPGVKIAKKSFIAAGAVVNRDIIEPALVMGVPGRNHPLPEKLDQINDRALTQQQTDLWHPFSGDPMAVDWPHRERPPLE